MKVRVIFSTILAAATMFLFAACQDSVNSPTKSTIEDTNNLSDYPWPMPRADREAEMAALWLSGEFTAPQPLYDSLVEAFASLRSQWSENVPELASIKFFHTFMGMGVGTTFDSAQSNMIRKGTFKEFNELNDRYHATVTDTFDLSEHGVARLSVWVQFESIFDLDSMCRIYGQLDGALYSEPNHMFRAFDYSTLIPTRSSTGDFAFLLCAASWEACNPQQPLHECDHLWYFRPADNGFELVGDAYFTWQNSWSSPPPEWWSEVSESYCSNPFVTRHQLCPDRQ